MRSKRNVIQQGFTLVGLMVVLVILGLLTGIAIPSYRSYIERAQNTKIALDIAVIEQALELFYFDMGRYPTQEGLQALRQGTGDKWRGPYLRTLPEDPQGHSYHYYLDKNQPKVHQA